jgi:hypothetical protein
MPRGADSRLARTTHRTVANGQHVAAVQRPSTDAGHHMHGRAAHHQRHIESAAHREVAPCPVTRWPTAYGIAGADFDGLPQGQGRREIRSGERDHGGTFEEEFTAGKRHLERGSIFGIAYQQIAGTQGQRVRRAGGGDPEMRVAETAEVLNCGQESGR